MVLTNYAAEDVRRQRLSLGASKVFDKSGEIDALIDYCLQLARHQPAPPSGPDGSAVEAG